MEADVPAIVDVFLAAFEHDAIMALKRQRCLASECRDFDLYRQGRYFVENKPNHHLTKLVDTETGNIVAFCKWHSPRGTDATAEKGAELDQPDSAAPTPHGYNQELDSYFDEKLDATAEMYMDETRDYHRAIGVRKKYSKGFASQQAEDRRDADSDKRHLHFVGILEHVRDVLTPYADSTIRSIDLPQALNEARDPFANGFAALELQELSESFLNAPHAPPLDRPSPSYHVKRVQDLEEAMTALSLLLKDFRKLRTAILDTWIAYGTGLCDIVSASVTNNIALGFARNLEIDTIGLLAEHGGVEELLSFVYADICRTNGQHPDHRSRPGDTLNFDLYEQAEAVFWPAYQLFRAFVHDADDLTSPAHIQQDLKDPNTATGRGSQKYARAMFEEDKILLAGILPQFALFCKVSKPFPVMDEMVRGMKTAFEAKSISLTDILAIQRFLDMHRQMGGSVVRGLIEAEKAANHVSSSIRMHLKFHASLKIATWSPSKDQVFHDILDYCKTWIRGDVVLEMSQQFQRPPASDRRLLSQRPLLCGLLAYHLKIQYREAGIALANAWGSIMAAGYLYRSLDAQHCLVGKWKDMEMTAVVQSGAWISGPRPTSIEESLRRFVIHLGYSAANFAGNRRAHPRPQFSWNGPKGLAVMTGIAEILRNSVSGSGANVTRLTNENLLKVIGILTIWEEDSDLTDDESNGQVPAFGLVRPAQPRGVAETRTRHRTIAKLTMPQLLEKLRNALQGEVLELAFDYLMHNRFCWKLLRAVKDHCAEELRRLYGPSYITKETELPFMVSYIFLSALGPDQVAQFPMFAARRVETITSQVLKLAANALNGLIGSGAGGIVASIIDKQYDLGFEI
ncbi:hypothetical protein ANO11243_097520 [Dothideomycetidae sp. 11243]|nr:hypothetical protein ANO11243_097520 [fungal sp. No.11243]